MRLLHTLGPASGQLLRVHVGGDPGIFNDLPCPPLPSGWSHQDQCLEGEVESTLARLASEFRPHLSVITSKGRTSWKDLVWGSTLERLIDQLKSPVLVLPADYPED